MLPSSFLGPRVGSSLKGAVLSLALISASSDQTAGSSSEWPQVRAAETNLVGPVTREELKRPPFSGWFEKRYSEYQPAKEDVEKLRAPLASVSIEGYFGTWCGDSKRQIPRLLNILDAAEFDEARLRLVGLSDRPMEFKKSPGHPEAAREIHRTPTIVVLRNGVELGRIVETPAASLEGDLLAILEGHPPAPNYGAEAFVHRLLTGIAPEEAAAVLKAAEAEIAQRSDPGSLWHYAEFDLLKNGRNLEAKALLDLFLRLNPRSVIGHVLLSNALEELGEKAEALAAAEQALSIDPSDRRARRAAERLRRP